MIFSGIDGEVGGHRKNLRPIQCHQSEDLSEADIIADGKAQFPQFRIRRRQSISRTHPVAFPAGNPVGQHYIKGMELGIFGGQSAVRPNQERSVEGTGRICRIAFVDAAGFQPDAQFPGQSRHFLEGRAKRNRFRFPSNISSNIIHGLRQHYQSSSPGSGFPDIPFSHSQVGTFIVLGIHLDGSSNEFGHVVLLSAWQSACAPLYIRPFQGRGTSPEAGGGFFTLHSI